MVLDRPRTEHRTPIDLVDAVTSGQVRIPPFQRPFRWDAADVVSLFDSLVHGYPVGNLLFWRRAAPAEHLRVGPIEVDAPETDTADWVVDGQQRITSLVGALAAADEISDPRFRIFFDLERARFRSLGSRQRSLRHWLPVNRLADTRRLLAWYRENDWLTDHQIDQADTVAKAIREYQVPTYVVVSADEDQLRTMFDRLNDAGKKLRRDEVFHALHIGLEADGPTTLDHVARATADLGFGRMDKRLALRCLLAYRGGDVYRDFHDEFESDSDRIETFRGLDSALPHVVRFLQEEAGIPHFRLLPYSSIVPVLVRWVRLYGEPSGRIAALLRRWVWRGAAVGIRAGATSVNAVRRAVMAVDGDDPYVSAQRLLSQFENAARISVDIAAVQMKHANARINLLGLLAAGPCGIDGEPIVPGNLVEERSMTREVVDSKDPLANTFANRVVHSAPDDLSGTWLRDAPADIAAAHLVDPACQAMLNEGDIVGFLQRRKGLVIAQVERHLSAMAEWGARDDRTLAELLRTAS